MIQEPRTSPAQMEMINRLGGEVGRCLASGELTLSDLNASVLPQDGYLSTLDKFKDWPVGRRLIAILLRDGELSQDTVFRERGEHPFDARTPGHPLRDRIGIYVHITTVRNVLTGEYVTFFYVGSAQAGVLNPGDDVVSRTRLFPPYPVPHDS